MSPPSPWPAPPPEFCTHPPRKRFSRTIRRPGPNCKEGGREGGREGGGGRNKLRYLPLRASRYWATVELVGIDSSSRLSEGEEWRGGNSE